MGFIKRVQKIIVLMLLLGLFHPHAADAANITCADTWSELGGVNAGSPADESTFKDWFPSGRRPTDKTCREIYIEGILERGDEVKFQQLLEKNNPFVSAVILNSHGGNVGAGILIGMMIRKNQLMTVAPSLPTTVAVQTGRLVIFPGGFVEQDQNITTGLRSGSQTQKLCDGFDCLCASSCTDIWAAGSIRYGNAVGVHQAFTEKVEDRSAVGLSAAEVKHISPEVTAFIQKYLTDMEVVPHVIDQLSSAAPDGMFWISADDGAKMVYPASTVALFPDCKTDFYPLSCYIKKMYAWRDAQLPPLPVAK